MTAELQEFTQTTMPPAAPGSLDASTLVGIAAHVLQANGTAPGSIALTAATTRPRLRAATARDAARTGPAATFAGPRGMTVVGTVPNYKPVTGAMLRTSPNGDWPIATAQLLGLALPPPPTRSPVKTSATSGWP